MNSWYVENWADKEKQHPSFTVWFEKEYGRLEEFSDNPDEIDEYWTRKAFALMGWIARETTHNA